MHRLKMAGLAAIGTIALLAIPSGPASAGGPLLFAPWALGHLIRAVTLPFAIAATAVSASVSYAYGQPYSAPPPSYYGPSYGQGYYPQGYAAPPAYYAAPRSYAPPVSYYGPSYYVSRPADYGYGRPYGYPYGYPYGRYHGLRGYDAAPRLRYSGPHGPEAWHGGGGYYRRR